MSQHEHPAGSHHEESDIDVRGVFRFAAGLAMTMVVVGAFIYVFFGALDRRDADRPADFPRAAGVTRVPPQPRLQTTPREDLKALDDAQMEILNSYGWVDRDLGIVRIPIDEAMRLTLERGLPSRDAAPAADPPDGAPLP
jgi:hypothetical protein